MGAVCKPQQPKPTIFFKANFTANLTILFAQYQGIVQFLRQTSFFASETDNLSNCIDEYLKMAPSFDKENKYLLAIDSTHKLHPLDYNTEKVTHEWLMAACLRQHKFSSQFPMELLNFEECYRHYVQFLYLCSRKPEDVIVPNKMADFLWHSHMLDNQAYKKDMKVMLGRVLNHIDDFGEQKMKEYEGKTQQYRKILLPPMKTNAIKTNFGGGRNYQGYGFIHYGGGVCGAHPADHHHRRSHSGDKHHHHHSHEHKDHHHSPDHHPSPDHHHNHSHEHKHHHSPDYNQPTHHHSPDHHHSPEHNQPAHHHETHTYDTGGGHSACGGHHDTGGYSACGGGGGGNSTCGGGGGDSGGGGGGCGGGGDSGGGGGGCGGGGCGGGD